MKLCSLDRQFIIYAQKYQDVLPVDSIDYKIMKWDIGQIVAFAKNQDISLRRKQDKNLRNACEVALLHLKTLEVTVEELSDLSEHPEDLDTQTKANTKNNSRDTRNIDNDSINQAKTPSDAMMNDPVKQKSEYATPTKRRKKIVLPKADKKAKTISHPPPTINLSSLGGVDEVTQELLQLIGMPLQHPEVFIHIGIDPPRGILLHGPPGCGKTMLANAIAGHVGVSFISIAAPEIVSGMSGESEKKIREVFEEARDAAPCILFIDEIDAITPKRETAQREMERRIVAQLLTCMDGTYIFKKIDISIEKTDYKPVIVIGATNRPDSLDPALRRAGRFDREISMGVPDERSRISILKKMCSKLKIDGDIDFDELGKLTPGFVGADLNSLVSEAGMIAVKRIFSEIALNTTPLVVSDDIILEDEVDKQEMIVDNDASMLAENQSTDNQDQSNIADQIDVDFGIKKFQQPNTLSIESILDSNPSRLTDVELEPLCINYTDFVNAIKKVQPSSKREGFATVPGVTWDDIGALVEIRDELRMAIVEPILHPDYFKSVGITSSMGVLLYGPPGCGKTLLAKAVANESHCNFLAVKGPELLNKYVGESERAIRTVFARAQSSSPCVIFFDELDALCPARSKDSESQSSSRLVNTLLTEMDGMQGRDQVFVIAATNRPDMIDPAMLRPGRLDKALYVDLPDRKERAAILKTVCRSTPLGDDVDLEVIAGDCRCDGMSGADLASLVREAAVTALRTRFYSGMDIIGEGQLRVCHLDFINAFAKVQPSVGVKVQ